MNKELKSVENRLDCKGSALHRMLSGFNVYIWLFISLFISYLIFSPFVALYGTSDVIANATDPYDGDARAGIVMALLLFVLVVTTLFITFRRRMTCEKLIFIVILAGLLLRFGYMLYTPFFIRGHDVNNLGGYGHLEYLNHLFRLEGLPASNGGQFYHPPFAHIAGAVVAKLYALLTGEKNLDTIFESAKLIPCFSSGALLVACHRLFGEFGFSKRAKLIALTLIAFHPTFIILSASINNDMLMIFFFTTAFLYTIRWYKNPTYKNILLLALSIGCAMSTKFSGALVAFFTAAIFLIVLIRKFRDKDAVRVIYQFTAFAAVCIPLGLWYHIRNLRLFGQALGYVARIPPESSLYVGDISFVERFLTISLPRMLGNVYCNPYDDFNIWEYTVKCALFGEYTFSEKHDVFAVILIISSLLLIVFSLGAMVWLLFFDRSKNKLAVLSLTALWALLMASFVFFNIRYPFGCTMDFRYIVPTVITGAAFLGLLSDKLVSSRLSKSIFICLTVILGVFCIAAACFYIV